MGQHTMGLGSEKLQCPAVLAVVPATLTLLGLVAEIPLKSQAPATV